MGKCNVCDVCAEHVEYELLICEECLCDMCDDCECRCVDCGTPMCDECVLINDDDEYQCTKCFPESDSDEDYSDTEDTDTSDDEECVCYNGDGRIYWPSGRLSPTDDLPCWYLCLECGEKKATKRENCSKCGWEYDRTQMKNNIQLTKWGCEKWPKLEPVRKEGADVTIGETVNDLTKDIEIKEEPKKKTAQQWYEEDKEWDILDPDGWPRADDNVEHMWWNDLITHEEYIRRRDMCTVTNYMINGHKPAFHKPQPPTNEELVCKLIPSTELFKPRKILCDRCFVREGTVKYEGTLRGEMDYWRICKHCWECIEEWTDPESSDSESEEDTWTWPCKCKQPCPPNIDCMCLCHCTGGTQTVKVEPRERRKRDMEENSPPPSPKKQKTEWTDPASSESKVDAKRTIVLDGKIRDIDQDLAWFKAKLEAKDR